MMDLAPDIAAAVGTANADGIAAAVQQLVRSGALPPGARLPTVRSLADELGVSPTTVAEAWRVLARSGVIETRGRAGSFVRAARTEELRSRYWNVPASPGLYARDLSAGVPDPALLPGLGPALAAVSDRPWSANYLEPAVLPELDAVLRRDWPFPPERLAVVNGAMDGIERLAAATIARGDRVLVEDPTFPSFLDVVEHLGAVPVGVPVDDEGLVADRLARALEPGASVLLVQPRAQNPTGHSLSEARARRLAELLAPTPTLVVEDDHSAGVAGADLVSLGRWLPERTVHVRGFSKSLGPDLRVAAVGGAAAPIDAMTHHRRLGPAWTSRLIQSIVAHHLTHPDARAAVAAAERAYAARRRAVVDALTERGVVVTGRSGMNLWIEVADERTALVTLAAHGIGAAPGSPFCVTRSSPDHIRLTISTVTDGVDALADAVAAAAQPAHRTHTSRTRRSP
jgi:DNA-binding transcriptional MocR family regulator